VLPARRIGAGQPWRSILAHRRRGPVREMEVIEKWMDGGFSAKFETPGPF
jgi:hypothetical protein